MESEHPAEHLSVIADERDTSSLNKKLSDRLFFVDNLRTFIIVLVALHHIAIIYGIIGAFYYYEPPYNDPLAFTVLGLFVIINQAHFLGLLFLISGYFSPGSLDRKGLRRFLRDRLIRLGIPLVVFFFVLNPISAIGLYHTPASLGGITTPLNWRDYPTLLGLGPMWFVAMLFIFDIGYAIWWAARRHTVQRNQSTDEPPRYRAIAAFIFL
jgi:Acyltransferase family